MDTTVEIIPAIMPDDYTELVSSVNLVFKKVKWIQVDVMDGKYTNSISWPYGKHAEHFENILSEDEGLPHWEDINYELDLMVFNPYEESLKWARAGASRIVLHNKSLKNIDVFKLIDELKSLGTEVGVAILPDENYLNIENVLEKIDFVQFMGINRVGFQNQEFAENVLDNISEFHAKYPNKTIAVDGAVNSDTAKDLVNVGVSRLVVGSYIFEGIPEDRINHLKEICSEM